MSDDVEKQKIPSLSPDELKEFIRDYLANQIFVMQHVPQDSAHLLRSIFMVLGLGGGSHIDATDIGTIYAYNKDAAPMGINGYPIFFSCKFMNKADWHKAATAIGKILDAQKEALEDLVPDDNSGESNTRK